MKITLSGIYETKPLEFTYRKGAMIELFSIAKELRFDGVDYCATMPDLFTSSSEIFEYSKKYKMPILGVHAPLHFLFYTPSFLLKQTVKFNTHFLDAEVFNFHLSGFIHPFRRNPKILKKLVSLMENQKLPLSIESNPRLVGLQFYPKVTYDPELFAEYCINHNLQITFDTAHVAHCRYDIVTFFRKYHQYIRLIHLSDSIAEVQHLPLGKGTLPLKALLREIKKLKYNNLLTFEICNFPEGTTTQGKKDAIRDSLAMVKTYAM